MDTIDKDNILKIDEYLRKHLSTLSDNILKLCHNEYGKRWRSNNKDKIKLSNIKYYNKIKITSYKTNNNQEDILKDKDDILKDNGIKKINPIEFNR